jgi:hypothetical protein
MSIARENGISLSALWSIPREYIGSVIREAIFMPLLGRLSLEGEAQQVKERAFVSDFWDETKPLKGAFPAQALIRQEFTSSVKVIRVHLGDKELDVSVRLIESKERFPEAKTYNFIHCLGNYSTIENNIVSTYPFLEAYLQKVEEQFQARFIQISQYCTSFEGALYSPSTLQEAGRILACTVDALQEEYGRIHVLAGRSLGSLVTGESLPYIKVKPDVVYLDRGPACLEKLAEKKMGGVALLYLARLSGWDSNLDERVLAFHEAHPNVFMITSGLAQDHLFPTGIHLSSSEKLIGSDVYRLEFDFPIQELASAAHHGIHDGHLDSDHLVFTSYPFMEVGETMAASIIRISLLAIHRLSKKAA